MAVPKTWAPTSLILFAVALCPGAAEGGAVHGEAWRMHVIDASSQGADGVRMADTNADGLLDIVTPWEEGGRIRVYRHPGVEACRAPWPAVTVGQVPTPEDAVFVDADGDGALDVVSCTEGDDRSVYVHWAPRQEDYLDETAWETVPFPALQGLSRWMYCLPLASKDGHGLRLVLGSKDPAGQIAWLEAPAKPRDLSAWRYRHIVDATWIMSILPDHTPKTPFPGLLVTDRKGPRRGIWRLNAAGGSRCLGGTGHEVMFLARGLDQERGLEALLAATRDGALLYLRAPAPGMPFERFSIGMPALSGTGKGVALGDLNGDGTTDVAVSCENSPGLHGVFWLDPAAGWTAHAISGPKGTKFDLLQHCDVDGDGDSDLITCEETENLGVIWYENPIR